MKVYAQRIWKDGELILKTARGHGIPGRLEVSSAERGFPVATFTGWKRDRADPNLFPPLYVVQIVKASRSCMRLRGWERAGVRVFFQEWLVDFSADGTGSFDGGAEK